MEVTHSYQAGIIDEMCFVELTTSNKHIPNHVSGTILSEFQLHTLTNTQQNNKLSMIQHFGYPSNGLYINHPH